MCRISLKVSVKDEQTKDRVYIIQQQEGLTYTILIVDNNKVAKSTFLRSIWA